MKYLALLVAVISGYAFAQSHGQNNQLAPDSKANAVVEEVVTEDKFDKAKAYIFADSAGIKWYRPDVAKRDKKEAEAFCKKHGLHLPDVDYVRLSEKEIGEAVKKDNRLQLRGVTSSPHRTIHRRAMIFTVEKSGEVKISDADENSPEDFVCIGG